MTFDRDQFATTGVRDAANAAMAVIDRMQDYPAHVQLHGIAAAFVLMADHIGMPAQDVFTMTKNLMNHADGRRPEFAAVADYMKGEL